MPPGPRDSADIGTCISCGATTRFIADASGTPVCAICGARQRAADIPRPRTGRRVVDVDSTGGHPKKTPVERTRAQSKAVAAVKRELGRDRPAAGAIDGSTSARSARPAPPPAPASPDRAKAAELKTRWRAVTDGVPSRAGRPHRETDCYREGEILLHTRFGMGLVEAVDEDGTLTVLFRAGYETLPSTAAPPDER
jgi:hypothetical protein